MFDYWFEDQTIIKQQSNIGSIDIQNNEKICHNIHFEIMATFKLDFVAKFQINTIKIVTIKIQLNCYFEYSAKLNYWIQPS